MRGKTVELRNKISQNSIAKTNLYFRPLRQYSKHVTNKQIQETLNNTLNSLLNNKNETNEKNT